METPSAIIAALAAEQESPRVADPAAHRPSASLTNIPGTNTTSPTSAGYPTPSAGSSRKLAAFRLQSLLSDPGFADQFLALGGLVPLRRLIVSESGNTLAYGLKALSRLVDLDIGVDYNAVGADVVERAVAVVSEERLVNILRGALGVLVAVVGMSNRRTGPLLETSGYEITHGALAKHSTFFSALAGHLGSADYGLATSALQLINGLVRGALAASGGVVATNASAVGNGLTSAITPGSSADWTTLVKQLQDVGVIRAVYGLARQDNRNFDLVAGLAEFEGLTKRMLGRWRGVRVNDRAPDHARALGVVYLGGNKKFSTPGGTGGPTATGTAVGTPTAGNTATSAGWRRIGFLSGSGPAECASHPAGFLGLMDLADFVRRHAEPFSRYLAEQMFSTEHERCPFGRASLAATELLFQHFCVDGADESIVIPSDEHDDGTESSATAIGAASNQSTIRSGPALNPLVLHWSRLHTATLQAFLRLWRETGAEVGDGPDENADFERVKGLVKVLISEVASGDRDDGAKGGSKGGNRSSKAGSKTRGSDQGGGVAGVGDISAVESDMAAVSLARLRAKQAEILDAQMTARWESRLAPVQRELENEALQFVREQRIRCLLAGEWFEEPKPPKVPERGSSDETAAAAAAAAAAARVRYVRLAPNRRNLHWSEFAASSAEALAKRSLDVATLTNAIDLSIVSAVVSNTSADENGMKTVIFIKADPDKADDSGVTIQHAVMRGDNVGSLNASTAAAKDTLLTLYPATPVIASEWLDGLLMVLNQQPITALTANLVGILVDTGLRVRLLNVPLEEHDDDYAGVGFGYSPGLGYESRFGGGDLDGPEVGPDQGLDRRVRPGRQMVWPDRAGTDDGYWYALGEA